MTESPSLRYGPVAQGLHWLLALAWLLAFGLGSYMVKQPFSPALLKWVNWHKWLGVGILALSLLRLFWRLRHRPPPLPDAVLQRMPRWQQWGHHAVHRLMYLLFVLIPLLGWAHSSARGFPIVWLGLWPLPDWVPVSKPLAELLKGAHQLAAWSLAALVGLHVAAVIQHQWIRRDGLLQRMLPWGG